MKLFKKSGLFYGRSFFSILIGLGLVLCLASGCDTKSQDTQKSSVAPHIAPITESIVPMFGRFSLPPNPDIINLLKPDSKILKNYSRANEEYQKMNYVEARIFIKNALDEYQIAYPNDFKGIALLYERYGIFSSQILRSQRADKDEPWKALETAISFFNKVPDSNREIARCNHFLGIEMWYAGSEAKAITYFDKAINLYGKNSRDAVSVLFDIAAISQTEKGLSSLNKALSIVQKEMGEEHPDTARIKLYIGVINQKLGFNKEALECFTGALTLFKKTLGDNSEEVAETYSLLGDYYQKINDTKEAFNYYTKAYRLFSGMNNHRLRADDALEELRYLYPDQGFKDPYYEWIEMEFPQRLK